MAVPVAVAAVVGSCNEGTKSDTKLSIADAGVGVDCPSRSPSPSPSRKRILAGKAAQ